MKYLAILIFIIAASVSITAQDSNYNLDRAVNKNAKLYKLDANQKVLYKEIVSTKYESYKAAKAKDPNFSFKSEAALKADKVYEDTFLAILNVEQKKIYQIQKTIAENAKNNLSIQPANQMNLTPSPVVKEAK